MTKNYTTLVSFTFASADKSLLSAFMPVYNNFGFSFPEKSPSFHLPFLKS